MYARIASFANPDLSYLEEMVSSIEQGLAEPPEIPGIRRFLMLVDRSQGTSLGISFFDTEEAIRAAEPVFERMGDEMPEEKRGRRTSVESYEVLLDEVDEGAGAARMSTLDGPPAQIDDSVRYVRERLVPSASDISGWRGVLVLGDRTNGRTKTITFWQDVDSLRASDERANELRKEAAQALSETIASVDRYEVAVDRSAIGARA